MIDVMAIKLKVIKAAFGITALSELELLHRLEKLYLEGIEEGVNIAKEQVLKTKLHTNRSEVMNPPASAAQGAEAGNLNTLHCDGTGAVPGREAMGTEAQAAQPSAAPTEHK